MKNEVPDAWIERHERDKYKAQRDELKQRLQYCFDNLPFPDTLEGNTEYDKTRIALEIPLT